MGRSRAAAVGLLALSVALGTGGLVSAEPDEAPVCEGRPATFVGTPGSDEIAGTPARDVIVVGAGDDSVTGDDGHDLICLGSGNDTVNGGPGADRILGGTGDDQIAGADDSDSLFGGPGADRLSGQRGNDRLVGGEGADVVDGRLGDDRVRGGPGDGDEAIGGYGIDFVDGGDGDGDVVRGDYGWDVMAGGRGDHDVASFVSAPPGPRGHGVSASLAGGRAAGDGRDRIRSDLEDLEGSAFADTLTGNKAANTIHGGPGNDVLVGGGGEDTALGGTGADRCIDVTHRTDCGQSGALRGSVVAQIDSSPAGGGGLAVSAGPEVQRIRIDFNPATQSFTVRATSKSEARAGEPASVTKGPGCRGAPQVRAIAICTVDGPVRQVTVDLGAGNDAVRLGDGLLYAGSIRVSGGPGDDLLEGGPEEGLFEADGGRDRLVGGAGADALIGGPDGPDSLIGGAGSDVLAVGQACGGGRIVGGPGRDNASFAETPAHPSVLYASLAKGVGHIIGLEPCVPTGIESSEDLEGSFDWDILVGNGGPNLIYGQPGWDSLIGAGGKDVLFARDGEADRRIDCGPGGGAGDLVFVDPDDPDPARCRSDE